MRYQSSACGAVLVAMLAVSLAGCQTKGQYQANLNPSASTSTPVAASPQPWIVDPNSDCKVWNASPVANETISWSGGCTDGYASGRGTLNWYKNGKPNGQYEGTMRGGKHNGQGSYNWPNGDTYTGAWTDGVRTGKGTYVWKNGNRYTGDFVKNRLEGSGRMEYAGGSIYTGQWSDGKRSGKGTEVWPDSNSSCGYNMCWKKYVGDYLNDKKEGYGTLEIFGGDKYTGSMSNDQPVGKTVYQARADEDKRRSAANIRVGECRQVSLEGQGLFNRGSKSTVIGTVVTVAGTDAYLKIVDVRGGTGYYDGGDLYVGRNVRFPVDWLMTCN